MKDANDRLLSQFPSRRLSAEEIRDTFLSISRQLDLTMGGPGFRLYEYQQDNVATYVPLENPGPETFRRAVYHHNARAARVDLLTDFDCPDPAFADPRRSATTTPLQALTMMNHGFSWTVTQAFANRLQQHSENVETQVHFAFELAYSRPPSVDEKIQAANLIRQHGLPVFCRALLNSNELINLN